MKKRLGQKIATQLIRMGFTAAVFVANLWELVTSRQLVVMASSVVVWECPQNQIYAQKIAQTNSGITHPYNLTEVDIVSNVFNFTDAAVNSNHANEKSEPCKGRFYRGKVNTYFDGTNLRDDRRLVLLKRKSCKGCDECWWLLDAMTEDFGEHPYTLTDIENGKLYKLIISPGDDPEEGPIFIFTSVTHL